MRTVSAVASLCVFATNAVCTELPQYDTDATCKTAAAEAAATYKGVDQDNVRGTCLLLEMMQATKITAQLDTLGTDTVTGCDSQAHGSYVRLSMCLRIPLGNR